MVGLLVRRWSGLAAAMGAAALLTNCAVGPDFLVPPPPETQRYTREPLAPTTSSTDAPKGRAQRFVQGRDIPQEWWRLFKSRPLNRLIVRAIEANPNLQAAL